MKRKKLIAREVLIFMSICMMVLGVWGFIEVRNNYYANKIGDTYREIWAERDRIEADKKSGKIKPVTDPKLIEELNKPGNEYVDLRVLKISDWRSDIVSEEYLREILITFSIITLGIAYVLRFLIILVFWSVKTLKASE